MKEFDKKKKLPGFSFQATFILFCSEQALSLLGVDYDMRRT